MPTLRWILVVILCAFLAACVPANTATPAPTQASLPSTIQPTLPLVSPTPLGTPEPLSSGIPVTAYMAGKLNLVVVSPLTGEPLEGFSSIPLGAYSTAFSPDGKRLAVVSDAKLYLIDLPAWQFRMADVDLHGPIYSIKYSPDGTRLVLVGGSSGRNIQILDARDGKVNAGTQAGFWIRDFQFTRDQAALMVYGPQFAETGIAANAGVSMGDPNAALYDLSDLHLLWSVKLDGVKDGTFPKKAEVANTLDIYQPGSAWYSRPGLAFAPNTDVLYVVHGDKDRLTTVDFDARTVKTVDLHLNTSWLDRLLSLTAGVAHAKGMDGTSKQAILSPDGSSLFVIGQTETVSQDTDGNWNSTVTPIGLQVIDPREDTLINKVSTEASLMQVSPDGQKLFLSGWTQTGAWTDVYDLSSRTLLRHLDGMFLTPTRRLDGKLLLASTNTVDGYISYVTLLDPQTWATIGEWKRTGDVGWLPYP